MGLWGGAEAVLGCSFVNPPRDSFKKVVRWESDHGAKSDVPRLNVRGGKVEPDLKSVLSPDVNAMKVSPVELLAIFQLPEKELTRLRSFISSNPVDCLQLGMLVAQSISTTS